jgi:hypothetical protein
VSRTDLQAGIDKQILSLILPINQTNFGVELETQTIPIILPVGRVDRQARFDPFSISLILPVNRTDLGVELEQLTVPLILPISQTNPLVTRTESSPLNLILSISQTFLEVGVDKQTLSLILSVSKTDRAIELETQSVPIIFPVNRTDIQAAGFNNLNINLILVITSTDARGRATGIGGVFLEQLLAIWNEQGVVYVSPELLSAIWTEEAMLIDAALNYPQSFGYPGLKRIQTVRSILTDN